MADGQSWKTAVEVEALGANWFVRVIEDGVVSIRMFKFGSDAEAFAKRERERLGIARPG